MIIKISDKLRNHKGVTLITLIIAITIFAVFITVFSYVMIAKHGSEALYVQSTQAYAVAQAGIEYGIRYAMDDDAHYAELEDQDPDPDFNRDIGNDNFTLVYSPGANTLTSTGTVGTAEREIILQNFTCWVAGGWITIDPQNIPYQDPAPGQQKHINVPLMNNYDYDLYIYKILLAKVGGNDARLDEIELGGTTVWTGDKVDVETDPNNPTLFTFNEVAYYTLPAGASLGSIEVQATSEVHGTWYLTLGYSKQSDLSDPQSSLVTFYIP